MTLFRRVLVVLSILAASAGCSDAAPREPTSTPVFERRTREDAAPDAGDERGAEPGSPPLAEPVTLAGRLSDARGGAIAGRRFLTRGADRDERTARTDEGGAIALEGVVPPYDLLVRGDGETGPTVHLGVLRADPAVSLVEAPADPALAQSVVVGVLAPSCGQARCVVDVVTQSQSGSGTATALSDANAAGDATVVVEVAHFWRARPLAGEPISVDVLVRDEEGSSFSHGRREAAVVAAPGEARDAGVVRATAVGASAPVRVAAAREAETGDASWITSVSIELAGQSVLLSVAQASGVTTRLPRLPGVTWQAIAQASEEGGVAMGWSGPRRADEREVALALPALPRDVAVEDGRLRWTGGGGALASIDVVDVERGRFRWRVVTNETVVPLARLEHLGLGALTAGAHDLIVRITPSTSLEAALAPDRPAALGAPGGLSYARVGITVTP